MAMLFREEMEWPTMAEIIEFRPSDLRKRSPASAKALGRQLMEKGGTEFDLDIMLRRIPARFCSISIMRSIVEGFDSSLLSS